MSRANRRGGRPGTTARKFFSTPDEDGDCVCLVVDADGSSCEKKLSGRFGGNLKTHLQKAHPDIFQEVVEDDSSSAAGSTDSGSLSQSKLWSFVKKTTKYKPGGREDVEKTEGLALLLGGTNIPKSIVENSLFKLYSSRMDPQYEVPSRAKITRKICHLRLDLDRRMKLALSRASRIAIAVDLWTKKDMTPFIGITAHFYDPGAKRRLNCTLAVKPFPHPHTAELIYDKVNEILAYWEIDFDKVFRVLTDNASNMIKAFRSLDEERIDFGGDDDDSSGDEIIEEDTANEVWFADPNLEESMDNETLEQFISKFDSLQDEQSTYWNRRHLRCIVHSIQLTVQKFVKAVNSRTDLIRKALDIIRRFSMSSKATGRLKELSSGRILRRYCKTRWSSMYNAISRLATLQENVSIVCQEQSFDGLLPSQWKQLSQLCDILEPFAQSTLELQAYKKSTLGLVLPYIEELRIHVKKVILLICTYSVAV